LNDLEQLKRKKKRLVPFHTFLFLPLLQSVWWREGEMGDEEGERGEKGNIRDGEVREG
jgi:hypothetical protein